MEHELVYLPIVYQFLIDAQKVELQHNGDIFNFHIKKTESPKLLDAKVPSWSKEYISGPSPVRGWILNDDGDMIKFKEYPSIENYISDNLIEDERKIFFESFKNDFISGKFYKLTDNLNYAFLLMYFILYSDDLENKDMHLYNLGLCYPKTFTYHIEPQSSHRLPDNQTDNKICSKDYILKLEANV
jgi:hypothetical protein